MFSLQLQQFRLCLLKASHVLPFLVVERVYTVFVSYHCRLCSIEGISLLLQGSRLVPSSAAAMRQQCLHGVLPFFDIVQHTVRTRLEEVIPSCLVFLLLVELPLLYVFYLCLQSFCPCIEIDGFRICVNGTCRLLRVYILKAQPSEVFRTDFVQFLDGRFSFCIRCRLTSCNGHQCHQVCLLAFRLCIGILMHLCKSLFRLRCFIDIVNPVLNYSNSHEYCRCCSGPRVFHHHCLQLVEAYYYLIVPQHLQLFYRHVCFLQNDISCKQCCSREDCRVKLQEHRHYG